MKNQKLISTIIVLTFVSLSSLNIYANPLLFALTNFVREAASDAAWYASRFYMTKVSGTLAVENTAVVAALPTSTAEMSAMSGLLATLGGAVLYSMTVDTNEIKSSDDSIGDRDLNVPLTTNLKKGSSATNITYETILSTPGTNDGNLLASTIVPSSYDEDSYFDYLAQSDFDITYVYQGQDITTTLSDPTFQDRCLPADTVSANGTSSTVYSLENNTYRITNTSPTKTLVTEYLFLTSGFLQNQPSGYKHTNCVIKEAYPESDGIISFHLQNGKLQTFKWENDDDNGVIKNGADQAIFKSSHTEAGSTFESTIFLNIQQNVLQYDSQVLETNQQGQKILRRQVSNFDVSTSQLINTSYTEEPQGEIINYYKANNSIQTSSSNSSSFDDQAFQSKVTELNSAKENDVASAMQANANFLSDYIDPYTQNPDMLPDVDDEFDFHFLPDLFPGDSAACTALVMPVHASLSQADFLAGSVEVDFCPYTEIIRDILGYLFSFLSVMSIYKSWANSNNGA